MVWAYYPTLHWEKNLFGTNKICIKLLSKINIICTKKYLCFKCLLLYFKDLLLKPPYTQQYFCYCYVKVQSTLVKNVACVGHFGWTESYSNHNIIKSNVLDICSSCGGIITKTIARVSEFHLVWAVLRINSKKREQEYVDISSLGT